MKDLYALGIVLVIILACWAIQTWWDSRKP